MKKDERKGNKYVVEGNVAKVYFNTCDKYFLCDAEDIEKLKNYTWCIGKDGYARTGKSELAHVIIMGKKDGLEVDHINRNRLDDRKCNLRHVTPLENKFNKDFSVYRLNNPARGVTINKTCKTHTSYVAYIKVNRKKIHLGCFDDLDKAIQARKNAEAFYWGEQAEA
jgi:hypothetical protein